VGDFKARLDVALGSPVWWLATLHIAGGLKLNDRCGPFQPRPFYDSLIACVSTSGLEVSWKGETLSGQPSTNFGFDWKGGF